MSVHIDDMVVNSDMPAQRSPPGAPAGAQTPAPPPLSTLQTSLRRVRRRELRLLAT